MRLVFIFLFLFFVSLANSEISFAQNVSDEPFIAQSNASGEEAIRELEAIVRDAKNSGERLFIISRLGTGEKYHSTNFRLSNTRQKLSLMGFNSEKTVFAKGENVKGEGRIQFYLGSHLRLVILAKRNQMPNLTCCEDYSPVKKIKPQRRTKQSVNE